MAFQYQESTLEQFADYAAQAFARGEGLMATFDPADGKFTGLVAVPSGGNAARYVAELAERRASTLNN